MTLKSNLDYRCPQCQRAWLPHVRGLVCPGCGRAVPDGEVTGILAEALESARYNQRLYGRMDVEYWLERSMGDRYLAWGFKALEAARRDGTVGAQQAAVTALMDLDLADMTPVRPHVLDFLAALVERYRAAVAREPDAWEKMPEPEKPFFGRKIIEDA